MRCFLLFSALLLLFVNTTHAQPNPKIFRAKITTTTGERIDGIFYSVNDSLMTLAGNGPETVQMLRVGMTPGLSDIQASSIRKIIIRRKGHVGRGALIGAGVGLAYGIGWAIAIPSLRSTNAGINELTSLLRVAVILSGVTSGAQYGALISLIPRKRVLVGGNADLFRANSLSLQRFAFLSQPQPDRNPVITP